MTMNVQVSLNNFQGFIWKSLPENTHYIGNLSSEERTRLEQIVDTDLAVDDGRSLDLSSIFGHFSIVKERISDVLIIVDHQALFPIFYRIDPKVNTIYISDSGSYCSSDGKGDDKGLIEFSNMFVTMEERTLWQDVHEVPAGCAITINKQTGAITTVRHYELKRSFPENISTNPLDICSHIFEDIANRYRNRSIIVPITAGADSRTITAFLKENGHQDIQTFSIGTDDEPDVIVGKEVAKKLGLPWFHIDTAPGEWAKWWNSDTAREDVLYSLRGGRINHAFMAYGLFKAEQQGKLPPPSSSIFMPGHAGSIAGGELKRIPDCLIPLSPKRIAALACNSECRIGYPTGSALHHLIDVCQKRTESFTKKSELYPKYAEIMDSIHTQDYISKFIANDVRNYERYGYEWYLPMLDKRWVEFWMNIPLDDALGKVLQKRCVNQITEKYGLDIPLSKPNSHAPSLYLFMSPHLRRFARKLHTAFSKPVLPLYLSQTYSKQEVERLSPMLRFVGEPINALLALRALQLLEEKALLSFSR